MFFLLPYMYKNKVVVLTVLSPEGHGWEHKVVIWSEYIKIVFIHSHLKNIKEESEVLQFMLACEVECFNAMTLISTAISKVW